MATPIRIKRSAVPNKKPTSDQLQLGELAVNFYDGKVFFKQDQGNVGVGSRVVEVAAGSASVVGRTIYVAENGDDNNNGLNEQNSKATIKAAVAIALPGDTVKVYPGTYVEDNPINLADNVSVEGTELRRCLVTPGNVGEDLFYFGEGCHITDISFVGSPSTDGASIVAFRSLLGTESDRYFDAARLIRQNIDFIAQETVGYITSTDYKNPAISIDSTNCADDIIDVYRAVCHDITRGGNSKCVEAGEAYFDINGNLDHIVGFGSTSIDAFNYSRQIARAVINNSLWGGTAASGATGITTAEYDNVTGIITITSASHGLSKSDPVRLDGLEFTCPGGSGITTTIFPDGKYGYIFPVNNVVGVNTFDVVVGISTIEHDYVTGGTAQKYQPHQTNFTQVRDLSIQNDPLTGFNNAIPSCANVTSAIYTCVGIVTAIIQNGIDGNTATQGITTTYPGNSGEGFSETVNVTNASYDKESGIVRLTVPDLNGKKGDLIELRDLTFSCDSGAGIGTTEQKFPSGAYGFDFYIDKVNANGTYDVAVGISTLDHTYVSGGFIVNRFADITNAVYDNTTGVTTITAPGAFVREGDFVTLRDIEFTCPGGSGITTTLFPDGTNGYNFKVTDVIGAGTTFVVNVGVSTIVHTYDNGGTVKPPFSRGTGIIRKGPYVRNCTNFVPNSIGAKIDGFNADEGIAVNDVGVQGSFNVDSYTQFNQGGIGVSVTNGAYCQLVSIFTICDDTAIYAGQGGQLDLTNSNSSFGTKGLVSEGIGDENSKCIDRYTGEVTTNATGLQNEVIISGLGDNRPYEGQALYFDRKYFVVSDIKVTNGGSGYTSAPVVTIDDPTGPGLAIPVQAIANLEGDRVSEILVFGGGAQFEQAPNVTIAPPSGPGVQATAEAEIEAIYYNIFQATEPSAGVSTVSLLQNLNNDVSIGTTVYFARQSLQIVSSHSFQYIGAGNTIESAYPSRGGVTIQENEVIKLDGGEITYTSTDQGGNFRIGDGVEIDQATGTVSGNIYIKSLFTQVTPFILALGGD